MSLYDENDEHDEEILSPDMRALAIELGDDFEEIEYHQDAIAEEGTQEVGFGTDRDERLEWLAEDERLADEAANSAA